MRSVEEEIVHCKDRGDLRPRILIDGSSITEEIDGLSVYIVNLLRHLPESSFELFRFVVLLNPEVSRPDLDSALATHPFEVVRARIASIGPRRDWDMFRFLRASRHRFDIVHITSSNYPLALRNGICTVHDVTFTRWFQRYFRIPGTAVAAQLYLRITMLAALRRSRAMIAVSQATKNEIERELDASDGEMRKIVVIHEGWEHLQEYRASECPQFAFEGSPYLFFIGTNRVHKNVSGLLRAFAIALQVLPSDVKLIIAGKGDRLNSDQRCLLEQINRNGERVLFTGYVSGNCVRRLFENAYAFILPSFSEGFGLPILEAFLAETPVLCSNRTAMPEVAGDAALYFDPDDATDIARAIVALYKDPAAAEALREAGRHRLHEFSWSRAATRTVELYQRCIGGLSSEVTI